MTWPQSPGRFVIDEDGFAFRDETSSSLEPTLYGFLELLDYAVGTGQGVSRWSDLWHVAGNSGRTLADTLFGQSDVDPDLRRLLGTRLDRMPYWDDDPSIDPPISVICGGVPIDFAPAIGVCLTLVLQGRGVACLTTDQTQRRGGIDTTAGRHDPIAVIHFLSRPEDGVLFWRGTAELENFDADSIATFSAFAFPRLCFAPRIWNQVRRFEGNFSDVRSKLMRDLAGLNDHGPEVWSMHTEPFRIAAEMASRAGIDCSLDSPQTHRNVAAMAERRVEFGRDSVLCEWHTKLERHRNRIHFAVFGGQVYVGVFADHLET